MKKIHPKESIRNLISYRPSVSDDKKTGVIRLSVNEGALGPSPKAIKELRKWALSDYFFHRYPDQINKKLIHAISSQYSLNPEQIVLGNGSDELIQLLSTAFIDSEEEAIYTEYGFLVFPQSIKIAGGKPIVAADKKFTVDVNEILKLTTNKTKLIFLANPNNPTGTMIPKADIEKLIRGIKKSTLLVIDSAYAEYVENSDYTDGAMFVENFPNVVMLRTFSKIHGLASLRLGWAYCPIEISQVLKSIRAPFSVNSLATIAGTAAIKDIKFQKKSLIHNRIWKDWTVKELVKEGIEVLPSVTNFFLINLLSEKNANNAISFLEENKIYVRGMKPYNLSSYIRVSLGNENEMRKFTKKLIQFCKK